MEAINNRGDDGSYRDRLAVGKLLRATNVLSETFQRGPPPDLAQRFAWEVIADWNCVLRGLKSLFLVRFGTARCNFSSAQKMCFDMHESLSLESFRVVRQFSRRHRHLCLTNDEFGEEIDDAYLVHVGITIRRYVAKLKQYLISVHAWDQFNLRHCSCCTKGSSQQAQQSIIDCLSDIESVVIPWNDVGAG
jgi:hypothetical protein